jgi:hypothetical protein
MFGLKTTDGKILFLVGTKTHFVTLFEFLRLIIKLERFS